MPSRVSTTPVELLIDARVVATIADEMRRAAPHRAAGFLLGLSSGVVLSARAHFPVQPDGDQESGQFGATLTGADYRRALSRARGLGLTVVASYATHPDGDSRVSLREIAVFRRSPIVSLVMTARANGADPQLDAYAPPTGGPIAVAVGRGRGREPA